MTDDEVLIDLVCIGTEHLRHGREIPDGDGHITVVGQKWAYCSADREDEPHSWRETGGTRLAEIRHADLDRYQKGRADDAPEDPRRRA
jgi:hypothetical protein